MINSIAYVLFSALAIVVLTGIIIIIRNSIRITTTYNFFKNKLKTKKNQVSKINPVNIIDVEVKPRLTKELIY